MTSTNSTAPPALESKTTVGGSTPPLAGSRSGPTVVPPTTSREQLLPKLRDQLGLFLRDLTDEFGPEDPEIQKRLDETAQRVATTDPLLIMVVFCAQTKPYLHLIEANDVEALVRVVLNLGGNVAAKMNALMTAESKVQIMKWIRFLVKISQDYSRGS